jgi:hypothetical protein
MWRFWGARNTCQCARALNVCASTCICI